MSLGPYEYEGLGEPDPTDPILDPDDEAERDDVSEATDYINPGDPTEDPDSSPYDTSWVPADRPPQHTDWGTTPAEEREGEPLDLRLREEEPDVFAALDGEDDAEITAEADTVDDPAVQAAIEAEGGDTDFPTSSFEEQEARAGRLVEEDEGVRTDTEKDMIATDVGIAGAGASAEEAAMHIVDEP
jgi:hypothetical protein